MNRYALIIVPLSMVMAPGAAPAAVAEEPGSLDLSVDRSIEFRFSDVYPGGIERRSLASGIRVRGWQLGERLYFGQAKVTDHWGVGLVFEHGDVVYGINHRGIQVKKTF